MATFVLPETADWDGDGKLAPPDRWRVQAAVLRGIAAAVARAGAGTPGAAGEAGTTSQAPSGSTAADVAAPPVRFDAHHGQDVAVLPSYDGGGAPVGIPVRPSPAGTPATEVRTASRGDRIVQRRFQDLPVIRVSVEEYLRTGGSTYVETPSLARAIGWGRALYGGAGFAILERRGHHQQDRFVVVGFDEPVTASKFGTGPTLWSADPDVPGELHATKRGEFFPLAGFWVVTAITANGEYLYSLRGTPWRPGAVWREYHRTPAADLVDPAEAAQIATALLTSPPEPGADATEVLLRRIVDMDRTVFALIPWEERAGYLTTLAGLGWPSDREKKAMVELVASARSRTELEAVFAIMRGGGAYERLFATLDGTVVDLLVLLGGWRAPAPMRAGDLVGLFTRLGLLPELSPAAGSDDLARHLRNAADGLALWVRSTVSGIKGLFEHSPAELAEGVAHLAEFVLILQRAARIPPDPEALVIVAQLAEQAGKTIRKAIAGLEYAEELGTPYGRRGGGARIAEDLLERLRIALAVEVLTWFLGIGEIKEALAAADLPARLAELLKLLAGLGRLGKAAEVAEQASKLDRFFTALVRLAGLLDEAAAARALRLLPEEQVSGMVRLAELLDLPKGAKGKVLRAAARDKGVLGEVEQLADGLSLARRIERRAAAAGGVSEDMGVALRRLLDTGWQRKRLAALLDAVPEQRLAAWSRAVTLLRHEQIERLGAQGLEALAYSPRSLAFVGEAGGDAYLTAFVRFRGDTRAVEGVLQGLELRKAEIGNPAEYQRLLDRIAAGEPGAYQAVAQRISTAAEATLGRLRGGGRRQLLEELAEFEEAADRLGRQGRAAEAAERLAVRDRLAAQVGELGDRELDGLEQLARIGDERGLVNWEAALDLAPGERADLLTVAGDVAGRLPLRNLTGIEEVLQTILERRVGRAGQLELAVQGSWGQLYAARTLIDDYKATALTFEVWEGPSRRLDIVADLPSLGTVSVEVKTNLAGAASVVEKEVRNDLVWHAATDYQRLLYLYNPRSAGELPAVREKILAIFDTPELQRALVEAGHDPVLARGALQRWLKDNPRTYRIEP